MKTTNKNLEWNVLIFDWNRKKVVDYNIFSYQFIEGLNKKVKANEVTNIEELKEHILAWSRRRYWARAEYEIMVGDLCVNDIRKLEKIDVHRQIMMNIDKITDYINKELEVF